jgi:hypothetical protein
VLDLGEVVFVDLVAHYAATCHPEQERSAGSAGSGAIMPGH